MKNSSSGTSVRAKLIMLAASVLIAFIGLAIVVDRSFARLAGNIDTVQYYYGTLGETVASASKSAWSVQAALYRAFAYAGSRRDMATRDEAVNALSDSLAQCKSIFVQLLTMNLDSQEQNAVLGEVAATSADYTASAEAFVTAVKGDPAAVAAALADVEGRFAKLNEAMEGFTSVAEKAGDDSTQAAAATALRASLGSKVVSGVAVVVVGLFVLLIIRSITRPLAELHGLITRVGTGDLTVAPAARRRDELGAMAGSVDSLVASLRTLVGTVKDRLESLGKTGEALAATMQQTGAAVIQINAGITSSGSQLQEQSAAVSEASAAIEELARNIDALSRMIADQSAVVGESAASVEEMIANVEGLGANAEGASEAARRLGEEGVAGKARLDEVSEAVASIVRYSENLGEAARLITEIADHTGLLAMNAAIEAAHAGEAGKGFAVVADEIQRLAEQSNEQAKEISGDLVRVANAIDSVKGASDSAVAAFGAIFERSDELAGAVRAIGEAMTEQMEGGRQVLGSLGRLKDITREIEVGSVEMASGNAAMLGHVSRLRTATASVLQGNEETLRGTKEINDAIVETTELTSRNASHIAEVREAADRFVL